MAAAARRPDQRRRRGAGRHARRHPVFPASTAPGVPVQAPRALMRGSGGYKETPMPRPIPFLSVLAALVGFCPLNGGAETAGDPQPPSWARSPRGPGTPQRLPRDNPLVAGSLGLAPRGQEKLVRLTGEVIDRDTSRPLPARVYLQ